LKIISFDNARVTWLFPLEEFTPAAGADGRAILAAIAARYGFTRLPNITTREDIAKNGLPFGVGQFEIDGGRRVNIADFIVYNDGIVAVAEKTEWAEKFLEDVVQWVKSEFGFRDFSSGIRKLYASTLIVDFETPLSRLLRGYELISDLISSHAIFIMPNPKPLQFSRLDFEVDKTELEGQLALPKFILERRSGVLFSQERYYAVAPMHTASHIEVLTEIERLAARS
jgi:hypothetical protein